jgi:hypothetical protein
MTEVEVECIYSVEKTKFFKQAGIPTGSAHK